MIARFCLAVMLVTCSSHGVSQQPGNPAMPCFRGLSGDPRFAPLREKVALGGSMDEMRRMTASTERAGAPDGSALAAWRQARDDCHRLEAGYYATRDSGIQALAREHFATVQALIARLEAGALTYGEFGRRRIELYEKVTRDIEEIRASILPPKPKPITTGQ